MGNKKNKTKRLNNKLVINDNIRTNTPENTLEETTNLQKDTSIVNKANHQQNKLKSAIEQKDETQIEPSTDVTKAVSTENQLRSTTDETKCTTDNDLKVTTDPNNISYEIVNDILVDNLIELKVQEHQRNNAIKIFNAATTSKETAIQHKSANINTKCEVDDIKHKLEMTTDTPKDICKIILNGGKKIKEETVTDIRYDSNGIPKKTINPETMTKSGLQKQIENLLDTLSDLVKSGEHCEIEPCGATELENDSNCYAMQEVSYKLKNVSTASEACFAKLKESIRILILDTKLEEALEKSKARVTNLEHLLVESKESNIELVGKLNSTNVRIKQLEGLLEASESKLTITSDELQILQQQLIASEQRPTEDLLQITKGHVVELEARVSELEDVLQKSNDRVTALQNSLSMSGARIKDLEGTIQTSEKHIIELEDSLKTSEVNITELEETLQASNIRITELEESLSISEAGIAKLEAKLNTSYLCIIKLENSASKSRARITDLETTLHYANARVAEHESSLGTSKSRITELEETVTTLEMRVQELARNFQTSEELVADLKVSLQIEQTNLTALVDEHHLVKERFVSSEISVVRLEKSLQKSITRVEELETLLEESISKVAAKHNELQMIQQQFKTSEKRVSELEAMLQTSKSHVVDLEALVCKLTMTLQQLEEQLTKQNTDLKSRLLKSEACVDSLSKLQQTTETKDTKLQEMLETSNAYSNEMNKKLKISEECISELEGTVKASAVQINLLQGKINEVQPALNGIADLEKAVKTSAARIGRLIKELAKSQVNCISLKERLQISESRVLDLEDIMQRSPNFASRQRQQYNRRKRCDENRGRSFQNSDNAAETAVKKILF